MLEVLEEIESERQAAAGANFGIYKSLIRKLVKEGNLSAPDRKKLDQVATAMQTPLHVIDQAVADLRELPLLEKLAEELPARSKAAADALVVETKWKSETIPLQRAAHAARAANVAAGLMNAGQSAEEEQRVAQIPNTRRKEASRLEGIRMQAFLAKNESEEADKKAKATRKQYAALLA